MLICFAFSFILPDIKLIGSILQTPISISTRLDLSFLGGAYGLYLLFGYFMCFKPHKPSWIIWLIGAAALFFIVCILQWWAAESGIKYSVWYNSTALLLCGCCIFKVFQSLPEINPNIAKIFKLLSGYSFAIFFLHRPIQMLIVKSGILSNLPLSVSVLFLWILSFGVSLLISYPLSKISLVKKYLLGVRQ